MPKTTMQGYRCCRCGHQWAPRNPGKPPRCAGCGSPYWDKPKRATKKAREGVTR